MTAVLGSDRLRFDLPRELEASEPPEARGMTRDAVRMLVAYGDGRLAHSTFALLPQFLEPGDLVVVNTSATLPARVAASRADGVAVPLHAMMRIAKIASRLTLRMRISTSQTSPN